jgi:ribA/ribD-fused uncharacterized protein
MTLQLPTTQSRATFSKVAMPYSMKLLDQELTTFANAGFRIVTEGSVGRLRETEWSWPGLDIEFKGEDRGVVAAPVDEAGMQAASQAAQKPKRTKGGAVAKLPELSEVVPEGIQFSALIKNEWQEFSNLALAPFSMPPVQIPMPDGKGFPELTQNVWPSVEHYYQAMKFPTEPEFQEAIRQEPSPSRVKKMGTAPDHGLRGDWETIKERVMKAALLQKFRQNPRLLQKLQQTGAKPLIYASKADAFWGSKTNRLGALLEEVRSELKDERPDLSQFSAASAAGSIEEDVDDDAANAPPLTPNEVVDAAEGIANSGVRLATIPEGTEETSQNQKGGVYLFINSGLDRGGLEPKARNARSSGPRRSVSWEGMSQSGGDQHQMTTVSGTDTEVKVEKLG